MRLELSGAKAQLQAQEADRLRGTRDGSARVQELEQRVATLQAELQSLKAVGHDGMTGPSARLHI